MTQLIDVLLFSKTEFLNKVNCNQDDPVMVLRDFVLGPDELGKVGASFSYNGTTLDEMRTFKSYNVKPNSRIIVDKYPIEDSRPSNDMSTSSSLLSDSTSTSPSTASEWNIRTSPIVLIPSPLNPTSEFIPPPCPTYIPSPISTEPLDSSISGYPLPPTPLIHSNSKYDKKNESSLYEIDRAELNHYHIDKPDALKSEFNTERARAMLSNPKICQQALFHDMSLSEVLNTSDSPQQSQSSQNGTGSEQDSLSSDMKSSDSTSLTPSTDDKEETLLHSLEHLKQNKEDMQMVHNHKDLLLQKAIQNPLIFERDDANPIEKVTQQDKVHFIISSPDTQISSNSWCESSSPYVNSSSSSAQNEAQWNGQDDIVLPDILNYDPVSAYKDNDTMDDMDLTHRDESIYDNTQLQRKLSRHIYPQVVSRSNSIHSYNEANSNRLHSNSKGSFSNFLFTSTPPDDSNLCHEL